MAQAVEQLPCQCKALSSNSNYCHKKKKKEGRKGGKRRKGRKKPASSRVEHFLQTHTLIYITSTIFNGQKQCFSHTPPRTRNKMNLSCLVNTIVDF
jgi:hypothetical protein